MIENDVKAIQTISSEDIRNRIYTIRGVQVMLDSDLAELYQVETKTLNQAVKRNQDRFPETFCFILTKEEAECSRSQFVTLNAGGNGRGSNIKYLPHAFTESGIAMLSAVLRSSMAVNISVQIMKAFVSMRHFISDNANMLQRLRDIDLKLLEHDKNFQEIFKRLEAPREKKASVFSAGQLWDAASYLEDIFRKATKDTVKNLK